MIHANEYALVTSRIVQFPLTSLANAKQLSLQGKLSQRMGKKASQQNPTTYMYLRQHTDSVQSVEIIQVLMRL